MPARRSLLPPIALAVMAASVMVGLYLGQARQESLGWGSAPSAVQTVLWPEPLDPGPFRLATHEGEAFTTESFRGRWSFVFFGYLGCPDVCPTSLNAMREFRRLIDPADGESRFIFVSVDPEHDRPEAIGHYLAWFDPTFVGLHGPEEEIARLARAMAVKYVEVVDDAGNRSIDHTSSVMIVDPGGRVVGAFPPPLVPEHMAGRFEALRKYLRG